MAVVDASAENNVYFTIKISTIFMTVTKYYFFSFVLFFCTPQEPNRMSSLTSPMGQRIKEKNMPSDASRKRSNSADISRPDMPGDITGILSLRKGWLRGRGGEGGGGEKGE